MMRPFKKSSHRCTRNGSEYLIILGALIWVFFGVNGTSIVGAQEKKTVTELRLATFGPPKEGSISDATQWFADEIEKRSGGTIKIKISWGGAMGKVMEMPHVVGSGLAEMATVVGNYHPELFPYAFGSSLEAMVLAGVDRGGWIEPYRKLYKEFPEEGKSFEKQRQKLIAFFEFDKVGMLSSKKLTKLEDMQGVKLRCSGVTLPEIYKAAGMVNVVIPAAEAYEAASRGMIQAIQATPDTALKYRLYEPCRYWIRIPMFGTSLVYFISINIDAWNKLSAESQALMVKVGEECTNIYPKLLTDLEKEFEKVFKDKGGEYIDFSVSDQSVWKSKIAKPVYESYISKIEKMGWPRAREIIGRFAELVGYKF
jgi:TRAP-type transport system periplasmic protein